MSVKVLSGCEKGIISIPDLTLEYVITMVPLIRDNVVVLEMNLIIYPYVL